MIKKFALGITFYHPREKSIEKLKLYKKIFDKVIVFDNTESREDYQKKLIADEDITYVINYSNYGLDKAYNYMIKKFANGFDFFCMLDQDSDFYSAQIYSMINYINENDMRCVGIIAPRIEYDRYSSGKIYGKEVEERRWVIASGSFVNLANICRDNIKFDEAYFIDRFDVDFCRMIREKSYKILMYNNAVLYQELGTNGRLSMPQHEAFRHYYIFRNRLYYNKKYYRYTWAMISMLQAIKHLSFILLFEDDSYRKIKECFIGLFDFFRGKMGKR